jgi:NTE family protein
MALFSRTPTLNLALQGGGAHGAFTWGVLDFLLEHTAVRYEGISGTSAGAMNAIAMAHGLMTGGNDGARETLSQFWESVAKSAPFRLSSAPVGNALDLTMNLAMSFTQYFSPYQLNPFDLNPLRTIVERMFDFKRLRQHSPVQLFIAATNANTGQLRLFRNAELSSDALLASACLPMMHHSIEIDGNPYWDGGYSANPAIFPLYRHCHSSDLLLILLAPLQWGETPRSAKDIRTRTMDIAFNAAFLREMRMITEARSIAGQSLLALGKLERNLTRLRFHLIDPDGLMASLPSESRMMADIGFLTSLRDIGRQQAQTWWQHHRKDIGQRGTVDLAKLFT